MPSFKDIFEVTLPLSHIAISAIVILFFFGMRSKKLGGVHVAISLKILVVAVFVGAFIGMASTDSPIGTVLLFIVGAIFGYTLATFVVLLYLFYTYFLKKGEPTEEPTDSADKS